MKKFLDNFEGYVCVVTLLVMSVVVFLQVVCRYVLHSSLPWSEELSRYLLVWTSFIGGAYGVKLGAHIGVEAFALLLPKKAQKALAIIVDVCCLALCVLILTQGVSIVSTQLSKGQLSPAMRIPMGYMYAAIPVGMAFFCIRYVQQILTKVKNFNAPEEKKEVVE